VFVPPPRPQRSRRLEDRIRELSSRIVNAENSELKELLSQLQAAMNEHTRRMRNKTSAALLAFPEFPGERRKG